MKKAILTLLLLCLFSAFLKDYKISIVKSNSVIHVPDDFSEIQEAINNANPGDTIFVHKGTYYENVVITKSISLIGEERESTIIDGSERESVLFIKGVDNVIVKGFTIRNSGAFLYNSSGILIERSGGNIITENIISDSYNGIGLFYSTNNVICYNNIQDSYEGIILWGSFNNLIKNNIISNNFDGIFLYSSQNNTFLVNTILNNSCGIYIVLSNNNIIYHNNFDNAVQVSSSESKNIWGYGAEGNYWSNYFGQDLNEDGIGDDPYVIDESGQVDSGPLMGMFFEFDFTYKGKTYQVAIISNSTISDFHLQIGMETGNKMIQFKTESGDDAVGFCRVTIPTRFMNYPYIVLVDSEEVNPIFLDISNETHGYLYFTYLHENQRVTIISSELYSELFDNYQRLQEYLYHLNMTHQDLAAAYAKLQTDFYNLLNNYTKLQESYQIFLSKYSENVDNVQNLIYIIAATAAILIIVTIYLSKHAYTGMTSKRFGEGR